MNWYKRAQKNNEKEIENLDKLQQQKNQGRGISCVRTLIMYLKRGDVDSAKAVYLNESDKIRSYPDVAEIIKRMFDIKEDVLKDTTSPQLSVSAPMSQEIAITPRQIYMRDDVIQNREDIAPSMLRKRKRK